ncbi:MAG: hypothetical protein M4579_003090 [Chaenotheca gracillima]|nr:MAG: hypothetical protein M4579_003090 [Chaenotheca gracillima]
MALNAAARPPPNLQPRPKAAPTSVQSSFAAVSGSTPQSSRNPSPSPQGEGGHNRHHHSRHRSRRSGGRSAPSSSDDAYVSDKATISLIRRTLCAHHTYSGGAGGTDVHPLKSFEELLLPPLTSSNDVDLQLYAFLAIIVREFVNPWYGRITPDHVFVDEVIRIVAHCTRGIEERLRRVDLERLLLDRIPRLIDAHFVAYRRSKTSLHPRPLAPNPRYVYHALHPHPALSPVPDASVPSSIEQERQNELVYRHTLVQRALSILLPADDLENECLRTLVGDIFSEIIVGKGISEKACEGQTWWNGITKLVEVAQRHLIENSGQDHDDINFKNSTLTPSETEEVSKGKLQSAAGTQYFRRSALSRLTWRVLQYAFLIFTAFRFVIIAIAMGPTSRSQPSPAKESSVPLLPRARDKKPLFEMHVFRTIANAAALPTRMPWLTGLLELLQWLLPAGPGYLSDVEGLLKERIPPHIPSLLLNARATLFPKNTLPPPNHTSTSPPSNQASSSLAEEEPLAVRIHCARTILTMIPPAVRNIYFATTEMEAQQRDLEETVLEPLVGGPGAGDPWVLRHLVFAIVECVMVEVLPELSEQKDDTERGENIGQT